MVSRDDIFNLIKQYYKETSKPLSANKVPVSGKVFDADEINAIVDAALDGWWTEGRYNEMFEKELCNFIGIKYCATVNSGSSANLIAFSALTSHLLPKERRLHVGDEVISVASAFPTTLNPIFQHNAIPVFIDVDLETYNIQSQLIEEAITEKTKVIFLAHTLGNPFDLDTVLKVAKKYNLWVIEDNCDSLGSEYNGKRTGSFGHIGTSSFYPAHHITTAEGGAVYTNDNLLKRVMLSVRDWGRDCWCRTGTDNTCNRRFSWKFGNLPDGYDHKYVYSHIGYNLKLTDLQAAIGFIQIKKISQFCQARRDNFGYLTKRFKEEHLDDYFILPKATPNTNPAWFGFLLTIKDPKINREILLNYLNSKNVATRLLFGGNLTKQPYFIDYDLKYRIHKSLENTDRIMKNTFWMGLYPALNPSHLEYSVQAIKSFINEKK
jgi:CDP-6-deoxy-D-xylo-4-hexulose-3-dehydrase